jgi:GAF domain-containing protein
VQRRSDPAERSRKARGLKRTARRQVAAAKPGKSPKSTGPTEVRGRDDPSARLRQELQAALEAQKAAAEILGLISASAGELEPVFTSVLRNATRLCEAKFGNLWLREGDAFRIAATHGAPPAYRKYFDREPVVHPHRKSGLGTILETKGLLHVADIKGQSTFKDKMRIATIELANARSLVAVPLLKENEVVGAIVIYRQEVRPFTDKQIELLQNFAAQAAIAIENARLLNELRQRTTDLSESLEQQTATSEVLKVISSSAGELQPVFETMLAKAVDLCEASFGAMWLVDGEGYRTTALHGDLPEAYIQQWRSGTLHRPKPVIPMVRAIRARQPVHVLDMSKDQAYLQRDPLAVSVVDIAGIRTLLTIPMLKHGEAIGVITIYRKEVCAFSEKQVALVQNFAAQAVIAIENARLLNELRERTSDLSEALEQQTATSEVLKVISSSSGELQPVFHALLDKATQLCAAKFANLYLADGDAFRLTTMHNVPPAFAEERARNPVIQPEPGSTLDRIAKTKRAVHIPDVTLDQGFIERQPRFVSMVQLGGFRAMLAVPMLKDGALVGAIMIYRQETGQFSDKQIELLQNFAAQAVIAIENARLLNELRESLQQQTATSEILDVISNSPTDSQPAFEAIVRSGLKLFPDAAIMIGLPDGDIVKGAAIADADPAGAEALRARLPLPLSREFITATAILDRCEVDLADAREAPLELAIGARNFLASGFRAITVMPMMRGEAAIGTVNVMRRQAGSLSEKQRELLRTFANQAVIAIENTRLFNELRQRTDDLTESLEQQTATSDVLRVISSSPGEVEPVFNALLANAIRICEATFGNLLLFEGSAFRAVAVQGEERYNDYLQHNPVIDLRENPGVPLDRIANTKQVVHVPDLRSDQSYVARREPIVRLVELGGMRTLVGVPMLKEGELIGSINMYRQEVRPFTDKQIELVQNFAAQAVIAIENTRLLSELRQSLEQQTATSEVLRVISSSPGELEPVFQNLLANATRLCVADFGFMFRYDGSHFHLMAQLGGDPDYIAYMQREPFRPGPETTLGRILQTRGPVQIEDFSKSKGYLDRDPLVVIAVERGGVRTVFGVPMMKENELIGVIALYRKEVRSFTEKQIELLQNFADQAVIAVENARLLNELRQSLEQQTATADVLRVISNSPTNVQPVFDSIAESAVRLCDGEFSFVLRFDGQVMNFASCFGLSSEGLDAFRTMMPMPADEGTASGRAIVRRAVVEIPDVEADEAYGPQAQGLARTVTYRSLVAVPLLHEGEPLGSFSVARANAGSFPERQVALLQAFADQAVIAIRNVRLFDEVQARTEELSESLEQQTATSEVLKVISNSVSDLQAVFNAMAENAVRLCEAERAYIFRFDGKLLQAVAAYNVGPENWKWVSQNPIAPGRQTVSARAALERRTVQVADVQADPEYTYVVRDVEPIHSVLSVPIVKGDELVGTITIYRLEVKPFTDKQIALVETFAAQAVIAIENTRLLNELRESLQQQTATADVLKAISRSTFDLNTVLQTLVEAAARLCDADQGTIAREQEGEFVRVATYGFSAEFTEIVSHMTVGRDRGSATGRALLEGRTVHIPDVLSDPDYTFSKAKELGGFRTVLAVPMLRDGAAIGVLTLTRIDVRPFTDKQIELVTTFADQAAIAIENVRLFESEEARTRELAKSLEELRTAQDRLVQTQKLASLGQLTAGIAHEIKNPLNFVNNFSGVSGELLNELNEAIGRIKLDEGINSEITELMDTLRSNLEKIVQHGKRADSIVKNMLLHSREGSGEHRPVDINLVVEESLNLAYHGARAERQGFNITLERSFDPSAGEVDLFPQEITRVFLNLISNGFYAATKRKTESGDDQSYEPTLSAATKNLGDRVEIRIRDNGTGIPPEVRERMFNPFFTTKPAGEGTGLGLSISHDIIVKQHAGVIEVESEPGKFTEFRIVLPRTAALIGKTGGQA